MNQEYLCRTSANGSFESCTNEMICELRESSSFVEYKQDTSYEYYLHNWYSQMDMMCMSVSKIGLLMTFYYAGYGFGGVLFAMPDRFGRYKTMVISGSLHFIT